MATSDRTAPRPPLHAYVLHHYDWSESSVILELFTRAQGRIAAVAKGAKRPYSQLRPVLLPFQRLSVQMGQRRPVDTAEVQLLRAAEWAGRGAMPSGAALMTALYLNELIMKGIPRHDPHPSLFDAYEHTLAWLSADPTDDAAVEGCLRAFELVLLREMGVLPELNVMTQSQTPVQSGAAYQLTAEGIAIAAASDDAIDGAVLQVLEHALARGDLQSLREASSAARVTLKTQLRASLHYHLATSAMRTRQLMLDAQRLADLSRDVVHRP